MKSTSSMRMVRLTITMMLLMTAPAISEVSPTGAAIHDRVFNDCSSSVLMTTNAYPAGISFHDTGLECSGFANLHVWQFSENGGLTSAAFNNGDSFGFGAWLRISGTSEGSAGIQLAPWWAQLVDGRINVRSVDGEIACYGGRLPFYSFTASQGLVYAKGDRIYLEIEYLANGTSAADPATVEYKVYYGSLYTSGPLPFDQGNPAEDPPYGLWGCLNDARAGGFAEMYMQAGDPDAELLVEFDSIQFQGESVVSNQAATWSKVKSLYR